MGRIDCSDKVALISIYFEAGYEQFTDFTCPHVVHVHLCFVLFFLVAPVDESAGHVEAFWIKKFRVSGSRSFDSSGGP